jgi:hypothetical protein
MAETEASLISNTNFQKLIYPRAPFVLPSAVLPGEQALGPGFLRAPVQNASARAPEETGGATQPGAPVMLSTSVEQKLYQQIRKQL